MFGGDFGLPPIKRSDKALDSTTCSTVDSYGGLNNLFLGTAASHRTPHFELQTSAGLWQGDQLAGGDNVGTASMSKQS